MTRLSQPSPYDELSHTADVGVVAQGKDAGEALCRAALAMAQLQAGGEPISQTEERELVAEGIDRMGLLVDFCRKVLDRFYDEKLLLGGVELLELSDTKARARGFFGRFDPAVHGEGVDLKAVTYARAALEPQDGGWQATLIFDI